MREQASSAPARLTGSRPTLPSRKSACCAAPRARPSDVSPSWSWWVEREGGQDAGGVAGVVAAGGGDAGMPGGLEDRDCQVAEGGHDLGAASCPDLGGIFAVGDVADVVQCFDAPVAATSPTAKMPPRSGQEA